MKQFLIEFEHDSRHLGSNGFGMLLVTSDTFENACERIKTFSVDKVNGATSYKWKEKFTNARNFVNLTLF